VNPVKVFISDFLSPAGLNLYLGSERGEEPSGAMPSA
jgi:hypothetical protein